MHSELTSAGDSLLAPRTARWRWSSGLVVLAAASCALEPNPSPVGAEATDGTDGVGLDATDAADATDGFDGADGLPGFDGAASDVVSPAADAAAGDGSDGSDGTDAADATDGTDATDGADGADGCGVLAGQAVHVSKVVLPSAVETFGCDADNDGVITDADGEFNGLYNNALVTAVLDVNAFLASSIAAGDFVLLAEVGEGAVHLYTGEPIDACTDLTTTTTPEGEVTATAWDGSTACSYTVDASSLDEAGCAIMTIAPATHSESVLEGGPGSYQLVASFASTNFAIGVSTGRVRANTAPHPSGGLVFTDGALCGQLSYTDIEANFDTACTNDPTLAFCEYQSVVLALLDSECGVDGLCSVVFHLEAAPAASLER